MCNAVWAVEIIGGKVEEGSSEGRGGGRGGLGGISKEDKAMGVRERGRDGHRKEAKGMSWRRDCGG